MDSRISEFGQLERIELAPDLELELRGAEEQWGFALDCSEEEEVEELESVHRRRSDLLRCCQSLESLHCHRLSDLFLQRRRSDLLLRCRRLDLFGCRRLELGKPAAPLDECCMSQCSEHCGVCEVLDSPALT